MAKDGQGQIEIPLFPRGRNHEAGGDYFVGDYGDANCTINLKEYTFLLFPHKENPALRTIILRPRKKQGK